MIAAFYAGHKNDFGPKTAWVVGQFGTKMVKTDNVAQGKFCINIIKMNNFAFMPIQSRSTARRDLVIYIYYDEVSVCLFVCNEKSSLPLWILL